MTEIERRSHPTPRFSRRAALIGGGIAGAGVLGWRGSKGSVLATDLPNARRTWLLPSANAARPAQLAPPSSAEIDELLALQADRTDAQVANALRWGAGPAPLPWTGITLDLIAKHRPSPPKAARALALVHAAMADAIVAVEDAQMAYGANVPAQTVTGLTPISALQVSGASSPSEHAAVAVAAAQTLALLFPKERMTLGILAAAAAESRLIGGVAFRGDVEAGVAIGEAVAALAVVRAGSDGADAVWDGSRPEGEGTWQPTPPDYRESPLEPMAGTWRPWLLQNVTAARPAPPPAWGSVEWQAELAAVQDAVARRTPEQEAAVQRWAGGPGTVTPAGLWIEIGRDLILRDEFSSSDAARLLATMSIAMADAFICCWETKFAYWYARPVTADPALETLIPTPPFPSYTSGHATISTAAATVLADAFPGDAAELLSQAAEAKQSRLWGGIHYPMDNEIGAAMGDMVGRLAIQSSRPVPGIA